MNTASGNHERLRERVVYGDSGQNLTGSFLDDAMPVAADIPAIVLISMHTPSRRTLSGTKGMSEGGVMGAVGAVVHRQPLTAATMRDMLVAAARAAPDQHGL